MSDPYLCPHCDLDAPTVFKRHHATCDFCQDDIAAPCPACHCGLCLAPNQAPPIQPAPTPPGPTHTGS